MALDGATVRVGLITSVSLVVTLIASPTSAANPRIVVGATASSDPTAGQVVQVLKEHMTEIGVEIDVEALELKSVPAKNSAWVKVAKTAASSKPGTIVLIGYSCGEKSCSLFSVDPVTESVLEVPVAVPKDGEVTTAFALAATAREVFVGPLIPELQRLARHGQNPSPPPPSPDSIWLKPPLEEARKKAGDSIRPWLWLETGYHGDHPHPEGKPNHGVWISTTLEPREPLGINVSLGWLGIRERSGEFWNAKFHRAAASIALRLLFSVGPAHVSIAPLVRFDMVFSSIENRVLGALERDIDLEIQTGGITQWHLPLSNRLEILVGAGLLFTVLSKDYEVDVVTDIEDVMPASDLRIIWSAGLAWSPL